MRAVIQRVSSAQVDIDGETAGSIGHGLLILLGVGHGDGEEQAERLWSKIARLRIFEDADGDVYKRQASSQLMRSHSSLPRSSPFGFSGDQLLRFMGYFRRSAPKHCCCWALPRTQPRCCG